MSNPGQESIPLNSQSEDFGFNKGKNEANWLEVLLKVMQ